MMSTHFPHKSNTKGMRPMIGPLTLLGAMSVLWGCGINQSPSNQFNSSSVSTTTAAIPGPSISQYPELGRHPSHRQMNTFLSYFTSRGFPSADLQVQYDASARVRSFHYHAACHGDIVTAEKKAGRQPAVFNEEGSYGSVTKTVTNNNGKIVTKTVVDQNGG